MYYLYKKKVKTENIYFSSNAFINSCNLVVFRPRLFKLFIECENVSVLQMLSRAYFWLITFGRYHIWFLLDGNKVIHSSYVVPKCYKFPFLTKKDYEIGPCITNKNYRNRGIYSFVLHRISIYYQYEGADFYMVVRSDNIPSIKGIEKAGFVRQGTVIKTKLLKIFRVGK